MLGFSAQEIDATVAAATEIFHDALIFGHVSTRDLVNGGVHDDVIALVEKVWRKKSKQRGSAASPVAAPVIDQRVPHVLQDTNWRLHLEMGHKQLSGQSNPSALFQLSIADPQQRAQSVRPLHVHASLLWRHGKTHSAAAVRYQSEKLDLEFSHDSLRSFLGQLNAMQTQIDVFASAAPA